jgi:IS30 family transposase
MRHRGTQKPLCPNRPAGKIRCRHGERNVSEGLGGKLCKTITFDQGKENSEHNIFTERTGIKVYFCNPHLPWEKGKGENSNVLIRDMLKGITDFRGLNQGSISSIAKKLNERQRKTLNFFTPNEVLFELR